ncbi:MAG TPA: hypothetical protein VK509_16185 [Polyangiales bacterium]|nr:hypothetical protein [Polyangiales bacterium]
MDDGVSSCGRELAASAEVPEAIARLFAHVALNLRSHAAWVGGGASPAARAEHDALLAVALDYENIAAAARRAAERMCALHALEPAPHDAATLDVTQFRNWMLAKIEQQRGLAELLLAHALESERAVAGDSQCLAGRE